MSSIADSRLLLCTGLLALASTPLHALQESKGTNFKAALALYRENRLGEALPLFEEAVAEDSTNPTTLAWLAETLRRVERAESAVVVARRALVLSPCHAFAHGVIGIAYNPQYGTGLESYDTAWVHLSRAVTCDPEDGNGWLNIWSEALRRGDRTIEERALRRLRETNFFSGVTLAYNRWFLRDLPPNAVILTNGDVDTYPALAFQLKDGLRRDVAVVNTSMLNLWWYVQLVHARFGLPLPADSATLATRPMCGSGGADTVCLAGLVLGEWRRLAFAGTLKRPLAALVESAVPPGPGVLVRTGPVALLRSSAPSPLDTAAVWRSLRGLDPHDFAGPGTSPMDRSAIRISSTTTQGFSLQVAWLAVLYGGELLRAQRLRDARQLLEWLRRFERESGMDTPQGREIVDGYARDVAAAEREP